MKVVLGVSAEQAERLVWAIERGELAEIGVIGAKVMEERESPQLEDIPSLRRSGISVDTPRKKPLRERIHTLGEYQRHENPATQQPVSQPETVEPLLRTRVETDLSRTIPPEYGFYFVPGSLQERLLHYLRWATQLTGAVEYGLFDLQGHPICNVGGFTDAKTIQAALRLLDAVDGTIPLLNPVAPNPGIYVPMRDGTWFAVFSCECRSGRICLTMNTRGPLTQAAETAVLQLLKMTIDQ